MIWVWLLTALAAAAEPSAWFGDWVLDPLQSDDPVALLDRSIRAPMLAANGARQMAADGGQIDSADHSRRVRQAAMTMLARTGQVRFGPSTVEGAIAVQFGTDEPIDVKVGRKWTRVKSVNGSQRLRILVDGSFVMQRRERNITVTEAFLDPDPEAMPVVVSLDGSGLEMMEFRRVYRTLPPSEDS